MQYLKEIGQAHDCYFTIEEGSKGGEAGNRLSSTLVNAYMWFKTLRQKLDHLKTVVPNLTIIQDEKNKCLIHLMDARLSSLKGYALDQKLQNFNYAGPLTPLLDKIAEQGVKISQRTVIPVGGDPFYVDYVTNITVAAHGLKVRNIISDFIPLSGHCRVLWISSTSLDGDGNTICDFKGPQDRLGAERDALLKSAREVQVSEVKNWPKLADKLKSYNDPRSPAFQIWQAASLESKNAIRRAIGATELCNEDRTNLAMALNQILQSRELYKTGAFSGVPLPAAARKLIIKGVSLLDETELRTLNHILLESYFDGAIAAKYSTGAKSALCSAVKKLVGSDPEAALKICNEAIELSPDDRDARMDRADVWIARAKYQKAADDYNWVLDHFPTFAPAYVQRAQLAARAYPVEEAVQFLISWIKSENKYKSDAAEKVISNY